MRELDWQNTLLEQREKYGKVVFTVTELANISRLKARSASVSLARLAERGTIQRYTSGRYGLPGAAQPEDLVPSIDPAAYITGMYALYQHQLITQIPSEISCFTNHRHNRSRVRNTTVGRIVFVCVGRRIYSPPPGKQPLASPEAAIIDYVYLCRRRGVSASDIVTFRNLHRLDRETLQDRLQACPATVKMDIGQILNLSESSDEHAR